MNYESNNQRKFREERESDRKSFTYTFIGVGILLGTALLVQSCNNNYNVKNLNQHNGNVKKLERLIR